MPNFKYTSEFQFDPNNLYGHMQEEFPNKSEFDVVIIGGGPNGLIAGAYLSKAGLSVCVVERRFECGGGLATEENLYPCFSTNPHVLYHMMVDYMPAIRDFELDGKALTWIRPNAQTGIQFADGSSVLLSRMANDTKDSFSKYSQKDANAFGRVIRDWRRIVDEIIAPSTYLPPMTPIELTMALQRTKIGQELLELGEKSPVQIITETFENDKIRTLLLYTSCMWGLDPHETGLGFMVPVLIDRAMHKCYCYGGSHKFGSALARQVVKNGGVILEAATVDKIIMENGRAVGVHLAYEDREIRAKAVMSTLDPHSTFLDMVGRENLPPALTSSVEGWAWDKWSFNTLHFASDEAPMFKTDDRFINDAFATIIGIESMDQLLAHWDNVVKGKIDLDNFGGHSTCQSRFDPTLSDRPGKHVSMLQIHAPYGLEGGWVNRREEIKEAMMEKVLRAAPNLRGKIISTIMEDPEEIEIRFPNMRRGSIKHGDYRPLQMGCYRPNQDCSSTRTPIEGLYVCGVSTFPGGLVLGGPGYIGANMVAEDLSVQKWWKPTPVMEKYLKTYFD